MVRTTVGFFGLALFFLILAACDADNPKPDAAPDQKTVDIEKDFKPFCESKAPDIQATVLRLLAVVGTNDCTEAARRLKSITSVDLSFRGGQPIRTLVPLSVMVHITSLDVSGNKMSNPHAYGALTVLRNLKALNLSNNDLREIPQLPASLEVLVLTGNNLTARSQFRGLRELSALKSVDFRDNLDMPRDVSEQIVQDLRTRFPNLTINGAGGETPKGGEAPKKEGDGKTTTTTANFETNFKARCDAPREGEAKTFEALKQQAGAANCQEAAGRLKDVRTLDLSKKGLTNAQPLALLTSLQSLNLRDNQLGSFDVLSVVRSVESITLVDVTGNPGDQATANDLRAGLPDRRGLVVLPPAPVVPPMPKAKE